MLPGKVPGGGVEAQVDGHAPRVDPLLDEQFPELGKRLLQEVARLSELGADLERELAALESGGQVHRAEIVGPKLEGDLVAAGPPEQAEPLGDLLGDLLGGRACGDPGLGLEGLRLPSRSGLRGAHYGDGPAVTRLRPALPEAVRASRRGARSTGAAATRGTGSTALARPAACSSRGESSP